MTTTLGEHIYNAVVLHVVVGVAFVMSSIGRRVLRATSKNEWAYNLSAAETTIVAIACAHQCTDASASVPGIVRLPFAAIGATATFCVSTVCAAGVACVLSPMFVLASMGLVDIDRVGHEMVQHPRYGAMLVYTACGVAMQIPVVFAHALTFVSNPRKHTTPRAERGSAPPVHTSKCATLCVKACMCVICACGVCAVVSMAIAPTSFDPIRDGWTLPQPLRSDMHYSMSSLGSWAQTAGYCVSAFCAPVVWICVTLCTVITEDAWVAIRTLFPVLNNAVLPTVCTAAVTVSVVMAMSAACVVMVVIGSAFLWYAISRMLLGCPRQDLHEFLTTRFADFDP